MRWRSMAIGAALLAATVGVPASATPGIHLERVPAEHGCEALELWNGDTLLRTFAAAWSDEAGGSCSRTARTAWLGDLFFFDWWGPLVRAPSQEVSSTGTLWATDGSDTGTLAVADLSTTSDVMFCENHSEWFRFRGVVFVHQPHGGAPRCGPEGHGELKATTGLSPAALLLPMANDLQRFSGGLLMSGDDGRTGIELHATDGTVAGTRLVRDIAAGVASSWPSRLHRQGRRFLFTAYEDLHGRELWLTDGTRRGTRLVRDIRPGRQGAAIGYPDLEDDGFRPIDFRRRVYFTADDGLHGGELWVSDGTARGTHLLKDIRPGRRGSEVTELRSVGARLCFKATDGRHGYRAWVSDGTAAGTHRGPCPR